MASSIAATVTAIYQAIAGGQSPTSSDLATYTAQLASGSTSAQVATSIENSAFVLNAVDPIIREYQAAFGRVPDQAGLTYWISVAAPNGPGGAINTAFLTGIATTFANSAEFRARYGSNLNAASVVQAANSDLVTTLYVNVLGRLPDAAGMTYWLNAGATVSQMLTSFANSAEFATLAASPIARYQSLEAAGTAPTSGSLLNANTLGTNFTVGSGDTTITGLPDGSVINLSGTGTGNNVFSPALGASSLNIIIGAPTGAGVTYGIETVKGFQTINLTAISGKADSGHTITFVNDDNTVFYVSGPELVTMTLSAGVSTGDKIDASADTGGVIVFGSGQSDILIGGSGKDTFSTGARAGTLTGNGGADIFDVHKASYGGSGQVSTITDFAAKTDSVGLINKGVAAFYPTATAAAAAATTLTAALNAAVNALPDASVNAQIDWFQFGGDTYVVESVTAAHTTVGPPDLVVKLTGLVDLSGSLVSGSTNPINGYTPILLS